MEMEKVKIFIVEDKKVSHVSSLGKKIM